MTYSEDLERRIAPIVLSWQNSASKKMFGGICYLMNGNMICGVYKDFLILRLGEGAAEKYLTHPNVRPFDITGKPMKGWIMVERKGYSEDKDLKRWIKEAKKFVETLPGKG